MLTPNLITGCSEYDSIPALLDDIDCKLAQEANSLYNNLVFMLNERVPASILIDLMTYKRILQYKYVNPDYASEFSIAKIASKIKILKYK